MQHIEGTFPSCGTTIYYQAWLPDTPVKAALLVVHGLGEHSGRYGNLVNHFVPLGYAVYAYDHIGHGKSGGRREYINRYEEIDLTLAAYNRMVKEWQPAAPLFLLGHSMGGLVVSYYLIEHQDGLRGAVISAPTVVVGETVTPLAIAAARLLSLIAPRIGVMPLDTSLVSRDAAVVRDYVNDPLVFHGKTPARLGAELLKAMQRVEAGAQAITLPVLIIQGAEDRIVRAEGARLLHSRVGSADKTLKIYQGLHHEVLNEPEHPMVLADIEAWLEARLYALTRTN